jgi:hypothetical protein
MQKNSDIIFAIAKERNNMYFQIGKYFYIGIDKWRGFKYVKIFDGSFFINCGFLMVDYVKPED